MNSTSRPRNIAVGSQIVFTPCSITPRAQSTATSSSSPGATACGVASLTVPACGHWVWTASSRASRCSWISVRPSSPASIGPVTVSTVGIGT